MKPRLTRRSQSRQRGFSLVTAIFLLVVLAALAAFIVTISAVQHTTVSAAVRGARAYQAARTGIEWGIYQAVNVGACFAPTFFNPPGLDSFRVDVACTQTDHQEGGSGPFRVFRVSAVASAGTFGSPDFASRRIEVTVTNAP